MQLLAHYPPFPVSADFKATKGQFEEITQFPYSHPL